MMRNESCLVSSKQFKNGCLGQHNRIAEGGNGHFSQTGIFTEKL